MNDYKKVVLDLNNNAEQRIQAAFHLENQATPEAIQTLGKALFTDPSPIVRHECAFALAETVAPLLMKAIQTDNNIFVIHEALATLGDQQFVSFIRLYIHDQRPEIAESAIIALQRLDILNL